MVTEEEAKTKWCPEVRIPVSSSVGYTGAMNDDSGRIATCTGSECMMWRWEAPMPGVHDKKGYCGKGGPVY